MNSRRRFLLDALSIYENNINTANVLKEGFCTSNKQIADINLKGNRIEANKLKQDRRKLTDNYKQQFTKAGYNTKQVRKLANNMALGAARNNRDKIEDLRWNNN